VATAGRQEVLDLGAEHVRERRGQLEAVAYRAGLEVGHGRELQRTGADACLHRLARNRVGDAVEVGQPNRSTLDRTAHGDPARLVEGKGILAVRPRARGVLELLVPEAADPLEPVPEERPDAHRVVVEPHLPVGADIEAGALLLADDGADRVAERLLVAQ
jgi:hypothetical protein